MANQPPSPDVTVETNTLSKMTKIPSGLYWTESHPAVNLPYRGDEIVYSFLTSRKCIKNHLIESLRQICQYLLMALDEWTLPSGNQSFV